MPETTGRPDLRDAQADDLPFLFNLYCDVRGPEISAWGWLAAQCDAFLRMQFEAQRRSYEASFPGSSNQIVLRDGQAIGRCLTARTGEEILLVDIALLAAHRNRGMGTWLMQQLMRRVPEHGQRAQPAGAARQSRPAPLSAPGVHRDRRRRHVYSNGMEAGKQPIRLMAAGLPETARRSLERAAQA